MPGLEEEIEVAYPQQPHCATVLLLDTSGSMQGDKIAGLNEGFRLFLQETSQDELASKRVDLSVITFGNTVTVVHDFAPVSAYEPVNFQASGATPMGEALELGMQKIEQRKAQYREEGVDYYRPWLFLLTDGEPTDMRPGDARWERVTRTLRESVENKRFAFFAVGVEGANMEILRQLSPPGRPPLMLKGLAFRELFQWLSRSQRQVSGSRTGDEVKLPPVDWGTV